MVIEPNGPFYEIPMKAIIERPQSTVSALLSNRHFVGFGGLPLGQSTYVRYLTTNAFALPSVSLNILESHYNLVF